MIELMIKGIDDCITLGAAVVAVIAIIVDYML